MVWPFGHYLAYQTFYEILNFNLVILTNFLREIWPLFGPFFHFSGFGLF